MRIRGLVQGVGFRPAMYRLATAVKLNGWVCNDGVGVLIHLEGASTALDMFRRRLPSVLPRAACVESIAEKSADCEGQSDFRIRAETLVNEGSIQVRIPPDRALCASCRLDVLSEANRRYRHSFASCIECGPRYSILEEIPYERHCTSMAAFRMCRGCAAEYGDKEDRRFHAEPIACPDCGPHLAYSVFATDVRDDWHALMAAVVALRSGRIVALKGLGGYQLLVRADDEDAVARLRRRKRRSSKPFAVMVASIEEAERIARISPVERELLLAPENPIVLLESRYKLADAVAPRLRQIGILLPTTPLHLLLLSQLGFPVVATSGNRNEEPIAIDDAGRNALTAIADAFLDHDREIVRRVDDSVVRVIDEHPMLIRLARGFAPSVLPALESWAMSTNIAIPPMLAVGGQQKVALALWTGSQAVLAQHLGTLDDPESRRLFEQASHDLARLYRCEAKTIAGDLHPDYFTTRWAQSAGLSFFQVQHHHAHAVACMVEHGLLGRDVLGITFDGTGFGIDGTIWGGEFLRATMIDFHRVASLDTFALPGGEAAIREPNRIALSLLAETFGPTGVPTWLLDRLRFSVERARVLVRMMERGILSPRTSSVGRLFDAIAALLLQVHKVSYEGESALWLESAVDPSEESAYPIRVRVDASGLQRGDWRPLIRCLIEDIASSVAPGVCAARFHNALARWTAAIAAASPCEDVVLGGGCFQNAHLTGQACAALESLGKKVYMPSRIPANDGGLAVGQLAVAMARWHKQKLEDNVCVSAFPVALSNDRH